MTILTLCLLLFNTIGCFPLSHSISPLASQEDVVKKLFHTEELAIKLSQQDTVIRTFHMFHNAHLKNVIPALEKVIYFLSIQEEKHVDQKNPRNQLSSAILAIQKQHIAKYCNTLNERLALYEKIFLLFYKKSVSLVASIIRLFKSSYESPIEKLAYQLEWYTFFEREHVLVDYNSALNFFSKQYNTTVPPCFAFWKENSDKVKVLLLLQKLDTTITTQDELIAEMGIGAAETGGDAIIGAAMNSTAETAAEKATEAVASDITKSMLSEAFGDSSFDFFSDTALDSVSAMVEDAAPTLKDSMKVAEDSLAESAENDASLLKDPEDTTENSAQKADDGAQDNPGESNIETEDELEPEDDTEDARVPKKTGAERLQELQAKHAARMEKLQSVYKDTSKGFFKRAYAYLSFGFKKVVTPLRWVNDRLDAFVSSKAGNAFHAKCDPAIKKIEDNPIRAAIKQLPPSWQGITEMMIQMEVMQATSIVAFWYKQDNEEEYAKWQKRQYGMSQLNTKFTSLMTVQQKQNLNIANQVFLKNLKILSTNKQQEQALSVFSQQWIEQAIFSSPPSSFFTAQSNNISNNNLPAIDDDYEFALSSMITPETTLTGKFIPTSPHAWHNVYRSGNWQYLSSNNTFCQLTLAPITGSSITAQANQVLGNTIFKEYIPPQQLMYSVSAQSILYTYQFPFFMGLLFNKGRWISGIPDRQQQTRFAGLFGAPNKKIYFVCEESKVSSSQEIQQGAPSTQSPFYRILNNPDLYTIEKNLFSPEPLPSTVTITATSYDLAHPTLANRVTATLSSPSKPKISYSITNTACSTSNGLQHGTGFVSAGCISSFVITSPQELTYTSNDLALMNKNLATILNSTQG